MDNAAHTPGPWSFDHDWRRIPTIFGPDGHQKIASVEKHKRMATNPGVQEDLPEREANAHLIKTAPVMLAALLKIEAYLERWADEPECGEFYGIAHDTIAKAKGATP